VKRPPHKRLPGEYELEEYGQAIAYVQADDGNGRHGIKGNRVVQRRQAQQKGEDAGKPDGVDGHFERGMHVVPEGGEGKGTVSAERPNLQGLRGLRVWVLDLRVQKGLKEKQNPGAL
jgi:hypothetical protein